jgi:hypothetical protein
VARQVVPSPFGQISPWRGPFFDKIHRGPILLTFLAEYSSHLVGFLILVAVLCLMGLKVTQQGKYLIWAIGTLGLVVLTFTVKQFWMTDNERIERVVYDLRKAVAYCDVQGVLENLTPDVKYVQGTTSLSGDLTRKLIRDNLKDATFDIVHVQGLQISAGRQTRRGKAEFRVYTKGALKTSRGTYDMGAANSTWWLGFEEIAPGVWKVNRITPLSVPRGQLRIPISAP